MSQGLLPRELVRWEQTKLQLLVSSDTEVRMNLILPVVDGGCWTTVVHSVSILTLAPSKSVRVVVVVVLSDTYQYSNGTVVVEEVRRMVEVVDGDDR